MTSAHLQRLSDRISYLPANHETDRPILAAISGKNRTLIVDAGNSPAHARLLLDQLSSVSHPRPELVAVTHWHWDHIFGLGEMNLPAIAHQKTRAAMELMVPYDWSDEAIDQRVGAGIEIAFCAEMIKKEFPQPIRDQIQITLPTILFEHRLEVDLGQLTCIIEHVGGDHSGDSSVIYVKEEKTLFLGDALSPDIYTAQWKYSPERFLSLMDKIESFDAQVYVESHYKPLTKDEFTQELQELKWVAHATIAREAEREAIISDLTHQFKRELTQADLTYIDYFCTGWE